MNRSACLIFNPAAGQNDPDQDLATIRELLEPCIDLDIRFTTPEVDADAIATEARDQGASTIIVAGGDGTLSAAAVALVGTNIPIGVIPRGTANALASALGLPDRIEAACQTILDGATRTIDTAQCNGLPMVLLAGIGFEAETIAKASRQAKDHFGALAYLLAGIQEWRSFSSFTAEIETEDKVIRVTASALTVANAAPPTSFLAQGPAGVIFDDGLLDLTVVAPASRMGAVAASYHLLRSALNQSAATDRDDIGYLRAKGMTIRTDPPQKVVLDGEIIGTTPIKVECIPGGLTIFVPLEAVPPAPIEKLEGLPDLTIESKPEEAGGQGEEAGGQGAGEQGGEEN
ncbi:MAG: YegS/Rv2252/BmrU family lipid kinase [Chroococcidiopsidaceae cyanobacterium CP_BM_RX_35]|nr:YegS/Rv2252/BmrU family lipid kinase [Chroococcidiopsidaceae cyanobacterium CP_BM_RX_35]